MGIQGTRQCRGAARTLTIAVATASAALCAPAYAADMNATANAAVVRPNTLIKTDDLDFGTLLGGPGGGTVTINPVTNGRSATGGATLVGSDGRRAVFQGTGGIFLITVSGSTSVTLTRAGGGAAPMTASLVRADGILATDIRPLVRLNVSIVVEENGRRESGYFGLGGRYMYDHLFEPAQWNRAIDEALNQALVNLRAVDAPAGEFTVLLGPGWPGVLLHEAVGHGLEGDFNRKGTSAFSGRIGERVAAPGVTVVDDGAMDSPVGGGRRGSLSIDDEGTPTGETVLIEDGVLKGYMQDRLNARLMGVEPTGNGRRESFAHAPMPRMTNTFMKGGNDDPAELLGRVKNGIFAKSFGGGQVDIVSGKFVFSCTEAYKIENGKLGDSIKGATLIGDGPSVLTKVTGIGNDMAIDEGIGICGKGGQSVPAGVGQPTLLVNGLTVGGTA